MLENNWFRTFNNTDLNMYQYGYEDCNPSHSFGPAVRDHYLIHYIRSGKGFFQVGNNIYHLEKGQGFLICPGIVTFYQADTNDPWAYSWVGFHGLKAEAYLKHANLSMENPIFKYDKNKLMEECLDEMFDAKKLIRSREIRLLSLLYMFLSLLVEEAQGDRFLDSYSNRKELYVKKTVEYIEMNYSRKISVEEVSRQIGLDRSYLGSIFKEYMNTPLQDFIINYRINKACELMKNNILSIGDISRSVGYEDPLLFSKTFSKVKGLPPREYRKNIIFQEKNSRIVVKQPYTLVNIY